jgi:hypothetical protein
MKTVVLSMAIGLLSANAAAAADRCGTPACCNRTHERCPRCGVPKTCKVVCEMQKVTKTVWTVECEEFCAALPRCAAACQPCSGCGKASCASCESCCDPCASLCRPMVPPQCGKVRCRKKLVKKEITCEVPVYKCVVVCCCPGCSQAACGPDAKTTAPDETTTRAAPLPPVLGASYLKSP